MEQFIGDLSMALFLGMFLMLAATAAFSGAMLVQRRGRRAGREEYTPPISVIIPAYNEGPRIGQCLERVRASDYPGSLEIIVVDDGSTDGTIEAARQRGARILQQSHQGKVEALNRGIAAARYNIILTIDADTFLHRDTIREIVRPLQDRWVGAVSGVATVHNRTTLLGAFQSVEYPYISLLRETFSSLFGVAPGVCGALACYRKAALKKAGGFRKDTALEDFDVAFHIAKAGFEIATAGKARAETVVPSRPRELFRQRVRWLKGSMQCVLAHHDTFRGRRLAMNYILGTQVFWFAYSAIALPLILYHLLYWLPANSATLLDVAWYFFRWFSLAGVAHMIWMIPQWGVNWVYIFGVLAGVVSSAFYFVGIRRYDRLRLGNVLAVFFFFPYTLVMSLFVLGGVASFFASRGRGTFIR